jgi:hypothetical protein
MADKFIIEKNIPIPAKKAGHLSMANFFKSMDVRDSAWVDIPINSIAANTSGARKIGYKFTARTEVKDGVKGCRVWRVA